MTVLHYSAFTRGGAGGNPAGVVLDATGLTDAEMQAIAAEVGYSETAFVLPSEGRIRYFSPLAEVAFCGHATIATAVALAERDGPGDRDVTTLGGTVTLQTSETPDGIVATLTSPPARSRPVAPSVLARSLAALRLSPGGLDPSYPPHVANAGNDHLVLGLAREKALADLSYAYDELAGLMAEQGWVTVHVFWQQADDLFQARNPFPPGGVVEDPATGAAAAAFGGYLRTIGRVPSADRFTILQGHHMGRPSRLLVDLSIGDQRVRVSGTAGPVQ